MAFSHAPTGRPVAATALSLQRGDWVELDGRPWEITDLRYGQTQRPHVGVLLAQQQHLFPDPGGRVGHDRRLTLITARNANRHPESQEAGMGPSGACF
jgi:hypothetical protein